MEKHCQGEGTEIIFTSIFSCHMEAGLGCVVVTFRPESGAGTRTAAGNSALSLTEIFPPYVTVS